MEQNKNKYLYIIIALLSVLVIILGGIIVSKKLLNKNQESQNIDYSNIIISNYWCVSKTGGLGQNTCLQFDDGRLRYGEPATDAIIDSADFEKITKINDDKYEIRAVNAYIYYGENDEVGKKYNLILNIKYNKENNSLTIINGKRIYQDNNKEEYVKTYDNLTLYQRDKSDFE